MAELQGYQQLQARLHAVGTTQFGTGLMKRLGTAAVREQKLLVHRKTGTTGRSIHVSNVTATSVTTQAAAAARFLEFGTKPHIIRPRVAKVLAWGGPRRLSGALRKGASATNFATIVHHPGSRPYPFMIPGAKLAVSNAGLADAVIEAWNGAA